MIKIGTEKVTAGNALFHRDFSLVPFTTCEVFFLFCIESSVIQPGELSPFHDIFKEAFHGDFPLHWKAKKFAFTV